MFCPKCGTENPNNAMFCRSCGNKLMPVPSQGTQAGASQQPAPASGTQGYTPQPGPSPQAQQGGYTPQPGPSPQAQQGGYTPQPGPAPQTQQGGYAPQPRPALQTQQGASAQQPLPVFTPQKKEKVKPDKTAKDGGNGNGTNGAGGGNGTGGGNKKTLIIAIAAVAAVAIIAVAVVLVMNLIKKNDSGKDASVQTVTADASKKEDKSDTGKTSSTSGSSTTSSGSTGKDAASSGTSSDTGAAASSSDTGDDPVLTPEPTAEPTPTPEPTPAVKEDVTIKVRQVDNSLFPQMVMYTSIINSSGETVPDLKPADFKINEIAAEGGLIEVSIDELYQVLDVGQVSIELVMDVSGSMENSNKMSQAKNAAIGLIDKMDLSGGDEIGLITFESYVYLKQEFTSDSSAVISAVNGIRTGDMTALYDAIYAGLYQTNQQTGSKCVVAFTDGMENYSSYSYYDVVNMARNTGIPVFIIGIGGAGSVDEYSLTQLAEECAGKYYSADTADLEAILEDIYISIYEEQRNYYVLKYTTPYEDDRNEFRTVILQTTDTAPIVGSFTKEYIPESDISGAFSDKYSNVDYIIPYSDTTTLTNSDLKGLTLAELRIARNEIFARHGRQFKDPLLNQWFYSKTWYLNIGAKYSPADFDKYKSSSLSSVENKNAEFIKSYESSLMASSDIFPNASYELLSEYDLALTKSVLKTALSQLKSYPQTDTLEANRQMIQDAIDKEEIKY